MSELTVAQLAQRIGAIVQGDGADAVVDSCAGLEEATDRQVSFLANRKYSRLLSQSKAGVIIVNPSDAAQTPGRLLLVAKDPYFAFREAVVALHGFRKHGQPGISTQAVIDPSATVGEGCTIQPLVHIAAGARIGKRCVLYPHCYIGPEAVLGDDCILFPNVTVYDGCVLGNRVTLHAGCVIGQDGFGYATAKGAHHKIPQVGNVVIDDDVEMGANCAVDRATVGSTRIGAGTKFSDLIAIGHGVTLGKHNLLVAQVGLAGSVATGDYVVIGGQVGVVGHLEIASGVQIAAKSGVVSDLTEPGQYGGLPAMPLPYAKRCLLAVNRLPEAYQELRDLKKKLARLEERMEQLQPPAADGKA